MLVLSRKEGQTIVIDGRIRVSILNVRGKVIRVGIEAPKEVPILREELQPVDDVSANPVAVFGSAGCEANPIAELGAAFC